MVLLDTVTQINLACMAMSFMLMNVTVLVMIS
jgi:hypothetical protein